MQRKKLVQISKQVVTEVLKSLNWDVLTLFNITKILDYVHTIMSHLENGKNVTLRRFKRVFHNTRRIVHDGKF